MTPRLEAYREWFAISQGAAKVLDQLYEHADEWQPPEMLAAGTDLTVGTCRVYISQLRKAMDEEAIDVIAGSYSLTEIGEAECRRAIEDHKRRAA